MKFCSLFIALLERELLGAAKDGRDGDEKGYIFESGQTWPRQRHKGAAKHGGDGDEEGEKC